MDRWFCLYCGGQIPCSCSATPQQLEELENQEAKHVAEYPRGRLLIPADFQRLVEIENGTVRVNDLLRSLNHDSGIRELAVRATEQELLQIVYKPVVGTQLLRWKLQS